MTIQQRKMRWQILGLISFFILLIFISQEAAADPLTPIPGGSADKKSWGGVAAGITGSFENIGLLITAGSYLAGLGFSIAAIMKFKQHKDNPSQNPIGTPIALVFIAAALLFLPSMLSSTGTTIFGKGAKTAGSGGCVMKKGANVCE